MRFFNFNFRYFRSNYKSSHLPHVVGHYAAGARLIGLTEKQLHKHLVRIRAANANSNSPYAQPLSILNQSPGKKRTRVRSQKSPLSSRLNTKKEKIKLTLQLDNVKRSSPVKDGTPEVRIKVGLSYLSR